MRIAIIPARGGSRRIPRKNIKIFYGKPIIAYSIAAAQGCGLFDSVMVSTEDPDIRRIALRFGADMWHARPAELAVDEIGTQEVMARCLPRGTEIACCIYATCPMLTGVELQRGYRMLIDGPFEYVYIHGQFYWGRATAFIEGVPLSRGFEIPPEPRHIDINTPEDWERAERMYAELHREVA